MDNEFKGDVAEDSDRERWSRAEWRTFELWEKVELRFRRKRRIWIVCSIALFLLISAIPVVVDSWPKWAGASASRRLAEVLSRMKVRAALEHADFRISFEPGTVDYRIERVESCSSRSGALVEEGSLTSAEDKRTLGIVDESGARQWGIPGLVTSLCYTSLGGIEFPVPDKELLGLLLSPREDIDSGRFDRSAFLLVSGRSGEIISD